MSDTASASMRAQHLIGPATFEQIEVPAPRSADLQHGDMLVKVLAGTVCGSDVPYFRGLVSPWVDDRGRSAPAIPGYPLHEIVGEVVASRVDGVPAGSRTAGWASDLSGLAELVITSSASTVTIDSDISMREALVLQPLACVLGTLDRLPDIAGRRVAVLGLGPFGLLFAHVAHQRGASHVVGVDRLDRSSVAETFGLDAAVRTSTDRWVSQLADTDRADIVIDAIGHQQATLNDAIGAMAFGGQVFCFGVPDESVYALAFKALFRRNGTLMGGTVPHRRASLIAAVDYLREHRELAGIVTHDFPFHQTQQAFDLASSPVSHRLKVAITVDGATTV